MKNKKRKIGFTLIELLAVIIVLAIIALIATPIIFNVIENAKIKSLENSCYGVIDAVRTTYAENLLNSENGTVKLSGDVTEITVSGEQPIEGTWEIDSTSNSNSRGVKIVGIKFASMKDYTCTNVNNDGTINSKVNCTKNNSQTPVTPTTKNLKNEILGTNNSNVITTNQTWTTAWQKSDVSGIYGQDTNNGTTYYFRGNPNNYLKFANLDWRIIRINEDGSIRIMLTESIGDKQFNSSDYGHAYMYYTNSKLKTIVDDWYVNNISSYSSVTTEGKFCESTAVASNATDFSLDGGMTYITSKENYTPTLECIPDMNEKGLVISNIGLITYDEVIFAGGWYEGTTPYYLNNGSQYWTMSPTGPYNDRQAIVWYIYSNGNIVDGPTVHNFGVHPVINLKADTTVTGNGTSSNPYIVK